MDGRVRDGTVVVGGDARQRYYDARGYGHPLGGNEVALSPVEAAHLLYRGDLDAVDGMGFREFVTEAVDEDFGVRFLVYADLRERGFYLSPAREPWVDDPPAADLVVYERGTGPQEDRRLYAIRVVGERDRLPAASLAEGVVAVVDEESEITYLSVESPDVEGVTKTSLPAGVAGDLLADRVMLWDPPTSLYREAFFGQPLRGRTATDDDVLQLSLVEAAYLAERGAIGVDRGAVVERGRAVEGERFDRRLSAYAALRERGVVPKTGFKFGADFRTYAEVDSVEALGHSELLVRVLPREHVFSPRDLALDVRLAHGVRKRMVFALVDDDVGWVEVGRITP